MPDIQPFRAYIYRSDLWRNVMRLLCPPYDVISPQEHRRLLAKHPDNFVRVELPSGSRLDKYRRAAGVWRRWIEKGVLKRDPAPALYIYETVFPSQWTGRRITRRGFFAAFRLRPWGRGIFPHEKTLPTPKADRLRLFKAVKTQTSPIQCLFTDTGRQAARLLAHTVRRKPLIEWTDGNAVHHRFWRRVDNKFVAAMRNVLLRSKAVIADGHHRYETSRAFSAWARGRGLGASPGYVLAYFCPAQDPGLEILPTHRVVGRDKRRSVRLEEWADLRPVAGWRRLSRSLRTCQPDRVGVFRQGRYYICRLERVPPSLQGGPLKNLAVARLHVGALNSLGKEDFFFTRRAEEAVRWARRENGWAFFLPPNSVEEVVRVATAGFVMPPKSTYFYPKIPSGLVSRSLSGDL